MPKGRRTRSRIGCTQCVRVSVKCNKGRPMCQRCVRLGFACGYSTRFIWKPHKPHEPSNNVVLSKPLITIRGCGICACPGRLTQSQLYNLFATGGNYLLHWTSPPQIYIVGKIARLYRQSPAVRCNMEALISLCNECCRLSSLTRIDRAIAQAKDIFGSDSSQVKQDVLTISTIILSQVAVRYTLTNHIVGIISLAVRLSSNNLDSKAADPHSLLEILGGLDMDAWIVGRLSEPLHGVERITGLSRPLLDLIARVSRNKDVSAELTHFIAQLPLPE
ncbi:hypothetical protein BDV12DRAFT_186879 [Aspergillus spectabilis]